MIVPFNPELLAGKTAVVTGGGTGIGRACALLLADVGARVVVAGRRREKLDEVVSAIEHKGGSAIAVPTNVRDPEAVAHLFKQTQETFGPVDILVCSAGGQFAIPADQLTLNGWHAVIDLNLNGTFYCTRAAGQQMIDSGRGGSIVYITSSTVFKSAPGRMHSGAARGGINSMTRTLAVEWAKYNIRVNNVAPGPVDTDGIRSYLSADAIRRFIDAVPLKRMATPEEVANAVVFLASPLASYITGATLAVDGGHWLNADDIST